MTTSDLFRQNIDYINKMIMLKKGDIPFYGTTMDAACIITDMDNQNHPYDRFFRGVYNSDNPIVFNRQAGFRPNMYQPSKPILELDGLPKNHCPYPNHVWKSGCSTVYPIIGDSKHDIGQYNLNTCCNTKYM
jgi:hypothetical protein